MSSETHAGQPAADEPAADRGWLRRWQRGLGHTLLVGLVLLLVLGSAPGSLLDAGGTPVATVRQLTSLGAPWSIFSPEVRDHARWTEVVVDPGGSNEQRWRVEDERLALLGFQGVRYRKLAESLRRSCRSAAAYANWAMAEHSVSGLELYNVLDEPRSDVEQERVLILEAQIVDGEGRIIAGDCAS